MHHRPLATDSVGNHTCWHFGKEDRANNNCTDRIDLEEIQPAIQ